MSRNPKATDPKRGDFKEQAGAFAQEAVLTLVELMRNSSSDPVRVAAARELIDRAHGKPKGEAPADGGPTLQEMVQNAFDRKDP
jgi:hypothetical protein